MTRLTFRRVEHCVYLLDNAAGDLLYIGATGNLALRLAEHADSQPWWPDVAAVRAIPCSTRGEMFALEAELQRIHRPAYVVSPRCRYRRAARTRAASDRRLDQLVADAFAAQQGSAA